MEREFIVPEGDCGGEWLGYKELVRCKDCQHWCVHEWLNIPWCRAMHIDRGEEDFCSYGKRREDD